MFSDLVGGRLVSLNQEGFVVEVYPTYRKTFLFSEDPGDCCGYNEVSSTLLVDTDPKNLPVITRIEHVVDENSVWDTQTCRITFFGEDKKLAEINTESGSGSGWQYGACVTVKCVETGEEEILSQW